MEDYKISDESRFSNGWVSLYLATLRDKCGWLF
jgi:hypothetical protein